VFERTTRIFSESLARSMNRRSFMRRTGEAVFVGVAALAAGQVMPGRARAGNTLPPTPTPNCSPPGPYCNLTGVNQPDGCHGGACFQHLYNGTVYQCRVYYQYYQAGCWTSSGTGGYWTCCDCECLNTGGQRVATCGCAQFSGGPAPRPDSPVQGPTKS